MDITYFGHSAFQLKGKDATVVTDPFDKKMVGFAMPQVSADIVTVSHEHHDHNEVKLVNGTARRSEPYVIRAPGEYEVSGIGVFGWGSYHDSTQGTERGKNTIYSILVDGVRIVHLGDLGEVVSDDVVEGLGAVDVLMVPVGGYFTIGAKEAAAVIEKLSPSLVIPMHYKMPGHSAQFEQLAGVEDFLKTMGVPDLQAQDKLKVTEDNLPEETQVILLSRA
jgi:L-ascorbate metabolism protein UlaG (beta-lactamase superfamily)